jgi:hypothetical protein
VANPDDDAPTDPIAPAETGGPVAGDRLSELRGRDLIRPTAELQAELSPGEIDQLAAWFGLPSGTQPSTPVKAVAQFDYFGRPINAEERQRQAESRAAAMAAVQPETVALLERHAPSGDRLIIFRPTLELRLDPKGFDRDLLTFAAREIHEVEIPDVIVEQMKKAVPQALLRDLHRSEETFTIEYEVPSAEDTTIDPLAESQAAMAASYRFLDAPQRAMSAVRDALQPLADAKASKWSEIRTPRRRVED